MDFAPLLSGRFVWKTAQELGKRSPTVHIFTYFNVTKSWELTWLEYHQRISVVPWYVPPKGYPDHGKRRVLKSCCVRWKTSDTGKSSFYTDNNYDQPKGQQIPSLPTQYLVAISGRYSREWGNLRQAHTSNSYTHLEKQEIYAYKTDIYLKNIQIFIQSTYRLRLSRWCRCKCLKISVKSN